MIQTMTICGDPAIRCEVDNVYMETYYFSIQFVIFLLSAAVLCLFFVILFDIGWVIARFMIARVTFMQENSCWSCQGVFDIQQLPRQCALCTFFFCRTCTFQTRIVPGYTAPQHVCTMCMLQSRQSIIRDLEEACGAGARKHRAVVGLVYTILQAVQSSRRFNLAVQRYQRMKAASVGGKRNAVMPVQATSTKQSSALRKRFQFEVKVRRFRSERVYAEIREMIGYIWAESAAQAKDVVIEDDLDLDDADEEAPAPAPTPAPTPAVTSAPTPHSVPYGDEV